MAHYYNDGHGLDRIVSCFNDLVFFNNAHHILELGGV